MSDFGLITFIGSSILLTLMPGPDILYVVTESLAKGKKWGITIAIGLVSGLIIHTGLAATGVGLLLSEKPQVLKYIQYAGALYLTYLAYLAYREGVTVPATQTQSQIVDSDYRPLPLFLRGFTMNVLNPKVTLFFLAFLPGFVDSIALGPVMSMMVLGAIFMVQAMLIFTIVSVLASSLRTFLRSHKFWSWVYYMRILVLLGIAVLLVL